MPFVLFPFFNLFAVANWCDIKLYQLKEFIISENSVAYIFFKLYKHNENKWNIARKKQLRPIEKVRSIQKCLKDNTEYPL